MPIMNGAAFSIPEACLPPPPPVSGEFDLLQPANPKVTAASRNTAKYKRIKQFMGPTLSAGKHGGVGIYETQLPRYPSCTSVIFLS